VIRWSEAALVALPFVLFAAWRLAGTDRRWTRALLWVVVCGLVLVAGSGMWLAISRGRTPDTPYVPARVINGRIVGGD